MSKSPATPRKRQKRQLPPDPIEDPVSDNNERTFLPHKIPNNNPYLSAAETAYLGTVIVDVRNLTTQWIDGQNRALDRDHVRHLITQFQGGIRRIQAADRLKVSVTKDGWMYLLERTVDCIQKNDFPPPKWSGSQSPTPQEWGMKDLQQVVARREPLTTHITSKQDPAPGLIIPYLKNLDPELQPVLEAGQHRKQALLLLLAEQKQATRTREKIGLEPSDEDYRWSVELYQRDYLKPAELFALRANRGSSNKDDQNGYIVKRLCTLLEKETPAEYQRLLKPKHFNSWISAIFGINLKFSGRILNIVRDGYLKDDLLTYCSTSYGAERMTFTWASDIIKDSLQEVWHSILAEWNEKTEKIFGVHKSFVEIHDWDLLMKIPTPYSSEILTLVFFPTSANLKNGDLDQPDFLKPHDTNQSFSQMDKDFVFQEIAYTTRRPHFLDNLDDREYCEIFTNLCRDSSPSWLYFIDFTSLHTGVAQITQNVLFHIVIWYDETFKFPQKAGMERKTFQWVNIINQILFKKSTILRGKKRGHEKGTDTALLAENIVFDIWKEVQDNLIWKDSALRDFLAKRPIATQAMIDKKLFADYDRTLQCRHWKRILNLVVSKTGPCFHNQMEKYNDPVNLMEQAWNEFGSTATAAIWKSNTTA
ncbi:hypothetical protein FE257_011633 [Aspergillus nanangensis]|uniref:Uncharacterized protein n=1 Tax=Aspergillus nanangensis TaxID=2582783 RepID=A0AAD4CUZ2_ASPNN|nr:hypothetical protein FE257_011633 [Aspergillus nanangensis]